jgi:hypothetical protein
MKYLFIAMLVFFAYNVNITYSAMTPQHKRATLAQKSKQVKQKKKIRRIRKSNKQANAALKAYFIDDSIEKLAKKNKRYKNTAILQGINKITTKISPIKVRIGTIEKFGNLRIKVRACWRAPNDEKPENKVLVKISEISPDDEVEVFNGWMFSSSPALSALEHPVYDITILECRNVKK